MQACTDICTCKHTNTVAPVVAVVFPLHYEAVDAEEENTEEKETHGVNT